MSLDSALTRFRVKEAALMERASVTIRRPGTPPTFNELTGLLTEVAPVVYSGPGYVRPGVGEGEDTTTGEDQVNVGLFTIKLPTDTDVHLGDVVTVESSTGDAGMVNRSFRVRRAAVDEWQITRRCVCEEVLA